MKKYLKYVLSFLIPIGIFCLALLINDVAPFGKYIITSYDSTVQYPGFFMALKNFHFYLFNVGFGFNFLGTVTYYLMSPLNLLIHFFDIYHYNTFYFLLIILKIGLCGLSMQYFLSHEDKHDYLWSIIFSIIYALIGFTSTYYYNVFWLDSIIMLPLVLVGINKIIKNKSPLFYIITLSITIILSFYTGYMCCIFSLIYFIYKLIEQNKYKDKKIIKTFIISSLLVGLISCIVLIPSFYALKAGKAQGYTDDYTKYFGFNKYIKYFFYSFTPGNYQSRQVSNGFAQVYCSLFVVSLFILSFFNKNINKKTKITTLIIILFYILSFSFNLMDYAWQFFQKPVWWQHRYSFTLSLFMIVIAYKNLMNFDNLKITNIKKGIIYLIFACLIIGGFILFYNDLPTKNKFRIFIIIFTILLLINYIFIFNNKSKYKYVIIGLIILELGLNCYISVKENNYKSTTVKSDQKIKKDNYNYLSNIKDSEFYRVELLEKEIFNKGLLYNYNGINYFNSVRNQKIVNLMENYLPLVVNSHCSFVLHKYDPYLLSLFNIKYLIGAEEINYFDNISKNIYRNNHPLGLGFMVNSNLLDIKLKKDDYFYNISQIYSKMLNKDLNLYYEPENPKITYDNVILDKKTNKYHFIDIKKPGYISKEYIAKENSYVVFDINKIGSKIYINDKEIPKTYQNNNQLYYYVQKGDKVKLEMPLTNDNEPQSITNIHYIKEEEYINIMNQLEKNILSNVKLNDKHIFEGQINIEEDNLLFTSIAYEKGMIIKVNGKQVKPNLILDTFVGLKLKKGNNIITIDYIPQGLILGISLSILGLIFTFIYVKTKKL